MWVMIACIDIIRKPFSFYTIFIIIYIVSSLLSRWIDQFLPVSMINWEDSAAKIVICFATVYNILHWKEIVNSLPKGFFPSIYDFLNLLI